MGSALVFARVVVLVAVVGIAAWLRPSSVEANIPWTCGPYDGYNFNTLELPFPESLRPTGKEMQPYKDIINLAVEGKLFPDTSDFRYQGLEKGPRNQRLAADPARRVPPTIYYSIAWIESTWANAASTVPWGAAGPALRSFDCGFGIGQVTSGMRNTTDTPTAKQALVGIHPAFNVAEGMRILAWHWNLAPQSRPVAGEGNPEHLEDWYYAIWGYNGFAFSNHPLNPDRDPLRAGNDEEGETIGVPIYHCWDSSAPSYVEGPTGRVVYGHGDYTYPELIYGCMRYPPTREGERLWKPVEFNMPAIERPEVAAAFDPEHYKSCYWDGPSYGCPAMDFPTSFPDEGIEPHEDIVGEADPDKASEYLGDPHLVFSGPAESGIELEARADGSVDSVEVEAENTGTFIAPFRIRTTERWLVVTDKDGPSSRYLHGSLAVGSEVEVIVANNQFGRETKMGHVAKMTVTLVPERMPPGTSEATVYFEPLFGGGSTYSLTVTATNNYSTPTPTATPEPEPTANPTATPEPEPTPGHRITIGGIVAQDSR